MSFGRWLRPSLYGACVFAVACAQPEPLAADLYTSVESGTFVGDTDSGGNVATSPNAAPAEPNALTTNGNLSLYAISQAKAVSPGVTLRWQQAVDHCLTRATPKSGGAAAVVLAPCAGLQAQSWVEDRGAFGGSAAECLTGVGTTHALTVTPCTAAVDFQNWFVDPTGVVVSFNDQLGALSAAEDTQYLTTQATDGAFGVPVQSRSAGAGDVSTHWLVSVQPGFAGNYLQYKGDPMRCLAYSGTAFSLVPCDPSNLRVMWLHDLGLLRHVATNLCLSLPLSSATSLLQMTACDAPSTINKFRFDSSHGPLTKDTVVYVAQTPDRACFDWAASSNALVLQLLSNCTAYWTFGGNQILP